jgi:SAM-dependent methyltransferase
VGTAFRLQASAAAFAALGARLRLATEPGLAGDPEVIGALDDVLAAAGVPPVSKLSPEEQARAAAMLRSLFRQTADIIEEPARPRGWSYTDPMILQGQGRASMVVPMLIAACSPDLADVTSFLDVGTGVGWLAVAATTQVWPGCEVVGIDVWDPSLELAAANVAGAGVAGRVTLRRQDLAELDDVDRFDCAWVPTFFLSRELLTAGLPGIRRALKPGGWVVLGRGDLPPDPLARAVSTLGTVRDGGASLTDDDAVALLRDAGFESAGRLDHGRPIPLSLFGGRKPM